MTVFYGDITYEENELVNVVDCGKLRAMKFSGYLGLILLGIIQGLTEFLPVSSSGHLVLGQHLLKLAEPDLLIDVILHLGTLAPVLWLYRKDLVEMIASLKALPQLPRAYHENPSLRISLLIIVATIPTGIFGVLLKDIFEALFSSVVAVAIALMVTGVILMLTRFRRELSDNAEANPHLSLNVLRAFIIGIAQGAAITPGISRSGSTIATGLLLGVERELAARFSFLMSIPAILGAVVLSLRKAQLASDQLFILLAGAIAAALSGYLALRWVVHLVKKGEMHYFSFYLWPLGLAVLIWTLMH